MRTTEEMTPATLNGSLVADIKAIIEQGKRQAYMSINAAMIETYWNVGRRIVEEEQQGQKRAKYGAQIINLLSAELTAEYGKGSGILSAVLSGIQRLDNFARLRAQFELDSFPCLVAGERYGSACMVHARGSRADVEYNHA